MAIPYMRGTLWELVSIVYGSRVPSTWLSAFSPAISSLFSQLSNYIATYKIYVVFIVHNKICHIICNINI